MEEIAGIKKDVCNYYEKSAQVNKDELVEAMAVAIKSTFNEEKKISLLNQINLKLTVFYITVIVMLSALFLFLWSWTYAV